MKKIYLLLIILLPNIKLLSQGEIDDEKKIFFRDEKSVAVSINNNGFGFDFRKGRRINASRKYIWEIDMHYVKHIKEKKLASYNPQNSLFVYGKMNFAWDMRFGVGFQKRLFEKRDKNGVAIRLFYNVGPSVLLLKPIYYEVIKGVEIEEQKFEASQSLGFPLIVGRSSFFKGVNETQIDPGAYIKGGVSFEYSKRDRMLAALELGASVAAYLNEVEIIWNDKNRFIYSIFVSIRWGRIVRGGRMKGVEFEDEMQY